MHIIAAIIAGIWIAFWIYWLAVAAGVKPGRSRLGRFAGSRIVVVVIVLILLRARVITGRMIERNPVAEGIGLALFLAGLGLAIWARRYLGRNWGTPMSQKEDPDLVTTGPYRRIRHPIYSGLILAIAGTAIALNWYLLIAALLIGSYFVYSATQEERYMTDTFPEAYPAYKRSTKMLVPYIF